MSYVCLYICLFAPLFLETNDPIGLEFYMGPHAYYVAQRTKQDGIFCMHNYAEISIIMRRKFSFFCSLLLTPYFGSF